MTDTPPDRLSLDPSSEYFDADIIQRGVGIRFKGVEKNNVEEYCLSENWIKVSLPNTRDRKGRPMQMKLQGEVVAYYQDDKAE
ncbi:DUF3297 family protein [Hirschia baltica]|uniref:Glutathione peroxidase n=1 Tax=Hirschia baltica (strain ATCC 49814 / DSM 5838 / IFAM 1418) TaxID=582402 RepID=C6XK67_HIRBI|nr:DUF3297 family protein [Hirschia baltica]ACT59512.1 glutathione peroxidase [Hirschia baltica ATCC 49814]